MNQREMTIEEDNSVFIIGGYWVDDESSIGDVLVAANHDAPDGYSES